MTIEEPHCTRHRFADWLLYLGLISAAAGVCVSIPLMYVGLGLGLAGSALLGRAVLAFCAGWQWAVALAAWMCLTTWLSPFQIRFNTPGFAYCWLAVPVWALAVSRCAHRRGVMLALLAGGGAALLLGIAQFVIGFDQGHVPFRCAPEGRRFQVASGFYSHWIRFGDAMAIWSAWLMALATRPWLVGVSAGVGAVGVIVSGARGAVLALAVGMWGACSTTWRRSLFAAVAGLLLVVCAGGVLWQLSPGRVKNLFDGRDGRTYIWAAAWQVVLQHPLTGIGNGAYDQAATAVVDAGLAERNPRETPAMGNCHNSYLSLLVLYGVPGLVLWFGWLFAVVRGVLRRPLGQLQRHPAVVPVLLATLGVMLVGGLTEDLAAYASSRFQLFFGLALALGLAARLPAEDPLQGTTLRPDRWFMR